MLSRLVAPYGNRVVLPTEANRVLRSTQVLVEPPSRSLLFQDQQSRGESRIDEEPRFAHEEVPDHDGMHRRSDLSQWDSAILARIREPLRTAAGRNPAVLCLEVDHPILDGV